MTESKGVRIAILLIIAMLAGCTTDTGGGDSDKDGLLDREEELGWMVTIDLLGERVQYHVTSDPYDFDTDDDGVSDRIEFLALPPLDPRSVDSDKDGLTDCQEMFHTDADECADHDFKGSLDGGTGTDPANADSDPGFSYYISQHLGWLDATGSTENPPPWGDGLSDGDELAGFMITTPKGGTRHVVTDPRSGDTDGDGLEDSEEILLYGSDPTVFDSDGDGCQDLLDPYPNQIDRYAPGLGTLRIDRDLDGDGMASVRIQVLLAESIATIPEDGFIDVPVGQVIDLGSYEPAPLAFGACAAGPRDPWTILQVVVEDHDDANGNLDVGSNFPGATPPAIATLWWDVRMDTFAESRTSVPTEMDTWSGPDGEITLRPVVTLG